MTNYHKKSENARSEGERSKRSKLVSAVLVAGFVIVIAVELVSDCLGYGLGHNSAIPVCTEQLVWSDEFNGSTIGPDWEYMIGDGTSYGLPAGWGNNELQYYTDRLNNSYVADGCLHIVALKEEYGGYNYTSARLRTKNKADFLYGRIESRMKLPTTKGMWPAFWMMPTNDTYGGWAASGEIDIMEAFVTDFPKQIVGSIHYGGEWPNNMHQSYYYSEDQTDFSKDFHVYAVEWEPNEIRWYVDGNLYGTTTVWWSAGGDYPAPFDQYFHILVNLAVGGNPVPTPDESTVFPQELVIDYIRVYQIREPHDVAVIGVTPSATRVTPGESVDITVVVMNNGTETETFNVTVYYNTTEMGTQPVTNLVAGATETLTFSWDTTSVAVGNYTIEAVAKNVTGETNTANNAKITVTNIQVIPEFPAWTTMLLTLIVLTFAIAVYKRRLPKTLIH